jgi:hypothetical protein
MTDEQFHQSVNALASKLEQRADGWRSDIVIVAALEVAVRVYRTRDDDQQGALVLLLEHVKDLVVASARSNEEL